MIHRPTYETTSWQLLAFSFSLIVALLVCVLISAITARLLQKYGRNDLLPWVVGLSLGISMIVVMILLLPRLPYILIR